MQTIIIGLLVLLFIYLSAIVLLVQYKGDTSIANFTWGGGVMLVAVYTLYMCSSFFVQQLLLTAMIVLWAMRLILYVYRRYTGRDPRFKEWKWHGLKALIINIGWVFGQLSMIAVMSLPIVLVNCNARQPMSYLTILGLCIWSFGFIWEAVSDEQLFAFMKDPTNKGKVMRFGLWRYSRHPNYFGEIVMWWAIYLIALGVPYGWLSLITPVTITILLIFVTGIPWIEQTMQDNAEYQAYKKQTSMLIPWFVQ